MRVVRIVIETQAVSGTRVCERVDCVGSVDQMIVAACAEKF